MLMFSKYLMYMCHTIYIPAAGEGYQNTSRPWYTCKYGPVHLSTPLAEKYVPAIFWENQIYTESDKLNRIHNMCFILYHDPSY